MPAEGLYASRMRVVGQSLNAWLQAALNFRGESAEVTFRSRGEDDAIDTSFQLQPQLCLDLLPGDRAFLPGLRQRGAGIIEVQAVF